MTILKYLFSFAFLLFALTVQATNPAVERGWVEDVSGTMTLEEVKNATETSLTRKLFSQGYSKSTFWLRLRVDPNEIQDKSLQNLIVRIRPPYQDQIWIYDPLGPQDKLRVTGDYFDWANDEYRSLNLNFVIPVGTEPRDIWIKLKTKTSTLTFIEVMTEDQVRIADRNQEILSTIYLAILLVCFGWAALTRINNSDKLLSAYLIREIVVIAYALAVLGYLRFFSSNILPAGWLDVITNLIGFLFASIVIWFDWRLIQEFKPNKWLSRFHGGLVFFFPILAFFVFIGKVNEAARLSSLLIFIGIFLALFSVMSTKAWTQTRNKPQEDQPVCSKTFLVILYSIVVGIALLHRLPLMGTFSGSEFFVYLNLIYPLITSLTLMMFVMIRLHRLAKNQEQKQKRLEFAEMQVSAERSQRIEQANFLKMLAHEMKTPLSVVRLAMGRASFSDKTHEVVDRAVTDMDSIIERLLLVERFEDQKLVMMHELIDLRVLIQGLCISLPGGDRIKMHAEGQLTLESDQQIVRVVLSNLLENALKYSPEGSEVEIRLWEELNFFNIQVTNAVGGAGFPNSDHIFEKYYRSDLARQRTGSGLGLYLVQSLVKLLGGTIRYIPYEKHICFEVKLPNQHMKV